MPARIITCCECGQTRRTLGKNLCSSCYHRQWKPPLVLCSGCNKDKPHRAKGLCASCYQKTWSAKNPEHDREYSRAYYWTHLDQKRAYQRSYRRNNQDLVREFGVAYRSANRDRLREKRLTWRAANPDTVRAAWQRRRSRKRDLPATLTAEQWQAIKVAFKHRCAYCGAKNVNLTQDHVTPLSKGGGYVIQNIVPACAQCNSRKGNRPAPKTVQMLMF